MATPVITSRIQNRRGTQAQFDNLYPPGYDGIGGCDTLLYPNVLKEGEFGLCTDTRRVFLGNLSGEYIELSQTLPVSGVSFLPIRYDLAPTAVWLPVPGLLPIPATPFFRILYDLTDVDAIIPDWNIPGTNFSKNGMLEITTTTTNATLMDTGTEINNSLPADISFKATLISTTDGPAIEVSYLHNFPYNLTFCVATVSWVPFI